VIASQNLRKISVQARLQELRERVASSKIMDVTERKERLSEIARGNLTDYQEAGLDGSGYISITKDSPNTAAIAGIESATKFDENGNTGTLFTKVKLHNPVNAIAELNKMEHIYETGTVVNFVNVKFQVGKGYIENPDSGNLLRASERPAIELPGEQGT
jgi:phage terminase small subunit